jgi:hypothetical protein
MYHSLCCYVLYKDPHLCSQQPYKMLTAPSSVLKTRKGGLKILSNFVKG